MRTEKFNKCYLILKSSAGVGAVTFMKRVNQIEENQLLLLGHCCYKLHTVRGVIQNILDWCRHLYSSCGSAKHW